MQISRDDKDFLILESSALLAWLLAGAVGLGPLGVAGFLYINDSSWQGALPMLFLFGPLALLIVYQSPSTLICFNRKKRKVLLRSRWPWGVKDEAYAFKNIASVTLQRVYGRSGASYMPALELKDGRKVPLSKLSRPSEASYQEILERIGLFVNAAGPAPTGKLAEGTGPIAVETRAKPETPLNKFLYGFMVLVALGLMVNGTYQQHKRKQERAERQERIASMQAQRQEREERAAKHRGDFTRTLAAAEAGDPEAVIEVARAYANAEGTRKDVAKAQEWTKKAIALDLPDGYALMGHFYMKGGGVDLSIREAERWYMQAAERGSAEGLYGLSTVHYFGKELPQDLAKAHAYMVLSARGRFGNATSAIDIIGRKLTPAQREQSRALVETWDRAHPALTIRS